MIWTKTEIPAVRFTVGVTLIFSSHRLTDINFIASENRFLRLILWKFMLHIRMFRLKTFPLPQVSSSKSRPDVNIDIVNFYNHPFILEIGFGKSSRWQLTHCLHRVDGFAGGLARVCPCVVFYSRTPLMISSLLLQQCSTCLARLTGKFCEIWDKWLYNCFFFSQVLLWGFVQNSTKHP